MHQNVLCQNVGTSCDLCPKFRRPCQFLQFIVTIDKCMESRVPRFRQCVLNIYKILLDVLHFAKLAQCGTITLQSQIEIEY